MAVSPGKILHSAFRERVLPELMKNDFVRFPGDPIWFGEYNPSIASYLYDFIYQQVYPAIFILGCSVSSTDKSIQIQVSIRQAKEEYPDLAAIGDNRLNDDELIYETCGHVSYPYNVSLDGSTWSRYKIILVDGFTMRQKKGSKEQLEASANEVVDHVLERLPYLWRFLFDGELSKYKFLNAVGKRANYLSMNNELQAYLKDNQPFWVK